jgi:SAM-dependent methyltransferase
MSNEFHPQADHDYSQSHTSKGPEYHRSFEDLPGRRRMWGLEQQVLREYLAKIDAARIIDFACGTGRITSLLHELLPNAKVTGIDISPSMLAEARANFPHCSFQQMDGRHAVSHFGRGSMDLVCAFRFFPNADPALRRAAADEVAALVRPGGWAIINNHMNHWSASFVARRLMRRNALPGTRNSEIASLFSPSFDVLDRRSLGIWPQSDNRSYLAPWKFVSRIEELNASRLSRLHEAGFNTIWLLGRKT